MKKIVLVLGVLLATALTLSAQQVTVISEKSNLRGTPSSNGKVVSEVSLGQVFDVIKQAGGWFLVQTPDYVGWIHGNGLKLLVAEQPINVSSVAPEREPEPARPLVTRTPPPTYTPTQTYPSQPTYTPSRPASSSSGYIRGPRGGCYYYGGTGRKVYVDRSLCN